MDISGSLAAELAVLTRAADNPDLDLEARLHAAVVAVERAIISYLGMTLTVEVNGHEITVSARGSDATRAGSSLQIPLTKGASANNVSTLTLFAATPGAFVDLAADLSYALGTPHTDLLLDAHLGEPLEESGVSGLAEYSTINKAIGILISQGHPPDAARAELSRLADLDDIDLHAVAENVLRSVAHGPDGDG